MLTRLLLRISGATRHWAIARLRRRKMKNIPSAGLPAIRNQRDQISNLTRQMHAIVASAANAGGGVPPAVGSVYIAGLPDNSAGVVIFDLVDGSHCYYFDPPGVCCCGDCG